MAETIGSRLRAAREAKGMSIEDIAFETRIHAKYVRALEADDYSNFASTTYAKSFLTLYSRFLGVDAAEALHFFAGSDDIRLGGQPLLATIETIESVKAPRTPRGPERKASPATATVRRESPGFAPAILGLLVFLLVAAIPVLWFLGKDAESIDEVTTKAKEIADATQRKLDTEGAATSSASVGTETPDPAPVEKSSAAAAEPARKLSRERERSVAADWVLEEEERNRQPVGAPETDSTLDAPSPVTAKPVDSPDGDAREEKTLPGSDPGASSALVAVAVSEEELGNESTQPGASVPRVAVGEDSIDPSMASDGAFSADRADDEADTKPSSPEEKKRNKPQPEQAPVSEASPSVEEAPPTNPDSPTEEPPGEADTPPVAAPLRAVPLIARPLAVPMEAGSADDEAATDPTEEASAEEDDSADETTSSSSSSPTVATPVTVPREGRESRSREEQRKREAADPEETPEEREERTFVDPRHRFPRPLR